MSQPAQAGVFEISVTDGGGFTASQFSAFTAAEAILEGIISDSDQAGAGSIRIAASAIAIDGAGGTLGRAGPTIGFTAGGITYATAGIMEFDIVDLPGLEAGGAFGEVILHEMMHVVGIGTLWTTNSLLTTLSTSTAVGRYTGSAALAAYNSEFGLSEAFIPVENDGGSGTKDGHWDEEFFGIAMNGNPTVAAGLRFGANRSELMTGFINSPTSISQTTKAAFIDLGYNLASSAVPEPTSMLTFASMSCLIFWRSRKRSSQKNRAV